jgi:hypothetical protein
MLLTQSLKPKPIHTDSGLNRIMAYASLEDEIEGTLVDKYPNTDLLSRLDSMGLLDSVTQILNIPLELSENAQGSIKWGIALDDYIAGLKEDGIFIQESFDRYKAHLSRLGVDVDNRPEAELERDAALSYAYRVISRFQCQLDTLKAGRRNERSLGQMQIIAAAIGEAYTIGRDYGHEELRKHLDLLTKWDKEKFLTTSDGVGRFIRMVEAHPEKAEEFMPWIYQAFNQWIDVYRKIRAHDGGVEGLKGLLYTSVRETDAQFRDIENLFEQIGFIDRGTGAMKPEYTYDPKHNAQFDQAVSIITNRVPEVSRPFRDIVRAGVAVYRYLSGDLTGYNSYGDFDGKPFPDFVVSERQAA